MKETLTLSGTSHLSAFKIALVLMKDLYNLNDLALLPSLILQEETSVALPENEDLLIHNDLPLPRVKLVRIENPKPGPYGVCEQGFQKDRCQWSIRGGQPIANENGFLDYIRLYLQPNGYARLTQTPFVDQWIRPGWGCQNVLMIEEGEHKDNLRSWNIHVLRLSPFLFAPRISLKAPPGQIVLDGKPWFYYDDTEVFLPNAPGRYRLEISETQPDATKLPHISRTYALLKNFTWDPTTQTLSFTADHPPYFTNPLPGNTHYTAEVQFGDYKLVGMGENGAIIPPETWKDPKAHHIDHGGLISFLPGRIDLKFIQR